MARCITARDYWKESDPDFNRQFRRRWVETQPSSKRSTPLKETAVLRRRSTKA
jgi:hypothetical protein